MSPDISETERTPIYNYVSICQNPITWKKFMYFNELYGTQVPTVHSMWYFMLVLNKYKFVHDICAIVLHTIPAIIIDTVLFLSGRKPR